MRFAYSICILFLLILSVSGTATAAPLKNGAVAQREGPIVNNFVPIEPDYPLIPLDKRSASCGEAVDDPQECALACQKISVSLKGECYDEVLEERRVVQNLNSIKCYLTICDGSFDKFDACADYKDEVTKPYDPVKNPNGGQWSSWIAQANAQNGFSDCDIICEFGQC